jgi:hypothetical protein
MDPAGRAAGIERTIAGPLPLSALSASWPLRFRQPRPLLLPQLPRPHKSSIGARVHREPAQASPVLSSGFDSSISHPLQLVEPFSTISRFSSFAEDAVTTLILKRTECWR